ncbi:gamma carbonic anhydrase family protein [Halobacteriales archaeon QS_9_67_17]|nr:MAG: gamma carbonic anhydrase family protein [Halobacteriales archaeon QS_9_67_17]
MVLRSFDGVEPDVHESAHVDETAVVIGDVTLEADASVWPNAVLRGDRGRIRLGEGANVQDGAVCHEGADIASGATVGHNAIVHAATVGERALVVEDTDVPARTLVAGVPAEAKSTYEESPWADAGEEYERLSTLHAETSERCD